jgi:hypothetical protein
VPFVLSGLALIYLHYAVFSKTIGDYIRAKLWPFLRSLLPADADDLRLKLPSWEAWIDDLREERGRWTPAGVLTYFGQAIVFGVPATGALLVTSHLAWSHIWGAAWWVWSFGVLTMAGAIAVIIVVERRVMAPRSIGS